MTEPVATELEPDAIADGVRQVAQEIEQLVPDGALYWMAPFQYAIERMAPRTCATHGLPPERSDDVAAYLMAAMNEYVVSLVGEFDKDHFEAWTAAAVQQEQNAAGRLREPLWQRQRRQGPPT